jgi:hypothetical protein
MKVSEKASLLDFWRAHQAHPQVRHVFLWKAFYNGESIVPQDYVIHSSEDSDDPGWKKTKLWKKKKQGKKQKAEKAQVAIASQGSKSELLDPLVTEPLQKAMTKQMSMKSKAELAMPCSESELELVDPPIIKPIKTAMMKQSSGKAKAKAVTPSGKSESQAVDVPKTKHIKTATTKQALGKGKGTPAAVRHKVEFESVDPPIAQMGMMSRKDKEMVATVSSCSESALVPLPFTKPTKMTTTKQTSGKGKRKAAKMNTASESDLADTPITRSLHPVCYTKPPIPVRFQLF